MTHEEKLTYMRIACGIVGYTFEERGLDMLVSMYDLVLKKKGDTDLHSIVKTELEVEKRDLARREAKKQEDKQIVEGTIVGCYGCKFFNKCDLRLDYNNGGCDKYQNQ